jgi:ADP-ribose pyrophosphatase
MIKTTKLNTLLDNKFFKVYNNDVVFNNKSKGKHLLIENNNNADGIAVLPVLEDGSILLLKNYRYAVNDWLYQIPKGGNGTKFSSIDDAINCALEEMDEEISYKSNKIELIKSSFESPSILNSNAFLFIAYDCEMLEKSKKAEDTEVIDDVVIIKPDDIINFIYNEKTCTSTLFLIERYLRLRLEKEIKELKRNKQ